MRTAVRRPDTGRPPDEGCRVQVGIVEYRDGRALTEADLPLGTLLLIIPNHACLAAACFDRYEVVPLVPRADGASSIGSLPVVGHWTRCPERW